MEPGMIWSPRQFNLNHHSLWHTVTVSRPLPVFARIARHAGARPARRLHGPTAGFVRRAFRPRNPMAPWTLATIRCFAPLVANGFARRTRSAKVTIATVAPGSQTPKGGRVR